MRGTGALHRSCAFVAAAIGSVVVLALVVPLAVAATALAVAPVGDCRLLLGFGEMYGEGSIHRGLDLAADRGDEVLAPVAGTVAFAGAVPADGGGTVVAVSVDAADGTRATVMPLTRASVRRGATVVAGQGVGAVADAGDSSSEATHLHLSLRRGSVYLDPAPLLAAAAGSNPNVQGTADAAVTRTAVGGFADSPAGSAAGAAGSAADPVHSANKGLASGVSLAPEPGTSRAPSTSRASVSAAAEAAQPGVVMLGSSATVTDSDRGGASRTSSTVVRGVDIAALFERGQGAAVRYARRHLRALVLGVGALLAGVAALTPLGRRAGSGEAVCAVRPEGDAVAAAAGR
jgi:Peptidase family M23